MRMLIAQITPDDEDFKTYRIGVSDFARFFGITHNSIHEQIEKSARALREREILIRKGKSWFSTGWLSSAKYTEGSGYVEVRFDKELKPYLLGLKGYFTQYELEKIVNFKSGYAMRLFELLKKEQFKADGKGYFKRSFEYDELRELLGIDKKEYEFFKDFRVRVVDSSVKEINSNPDINIIKVEYPKTGRKVSHIVFHCEKAKQLQLDIDGPLPKFEEAPKEQPEYIKQLLAFGISEETAQKWKRKYGVARIVRNLGFVTGKKNTGKVKEDLAGYLSSAMANDYGQGWEDKAKIQEDETKKRQAEEEQKRRKEEAEKKRQEAENKKLWSEFQALPEAEKEAYALSVIGDSSVTLGIYKRSGIESAMIRALIIKSLKEDIAKNGE